MQEQKIIQIIPADGWEAECKTESGYYIHRPVICFALIEDKQGNREIKGVYKWEKDTCLCEDDPEFTQYIKGVQP